MTESVEWERLADHEEGVKANVTPWWELSGMERELAKYDQCEEPGDCDHDHDNAIEYFREQELNGLRAERDAANKRADAAERELAVLPERWRDLMAERDAARQELAEGRERMIGNGWRQEWGVQHPLLGTEYVQGSENARYLCRTRNEEHPGYEWRVVRRLTGEWKAADDA